MDITQVNTNNNTGGEYWYWKKYLCLPGTLCHHKLIQLICCIILSWLSRALSRNLYFCICLNCRKLWNFWQEGPVSFETYCYSWEHINFQALLTFLLLKLNITLCWNPECLKIKLFCQGSAFCNSSWPY